MNFACSVAILSLFIHQLQRQNNSLVRAAPHSGTFVHPSTSLHFIRCKCPFINCSCWTSTQFKSIQMWYLFIKCTIEFQSKLKTFLHCLYTFIQYMYLLWLLCAHRDLFLQLISLFFIRLQSKNFIYCGFDPPIRRYQCWGIASHGLHAYFHGPATTAN